MKELNLKFDIKKMTEEYNAIGNTMLECFGDNVHGKGLTNEQMSEMIQKHLERLGYKYDLHCFKMPFIVYSLGKHSFYDVDVFNNEDCKEAGLEFFSIKPEPKMVTVKMSEAEWINIITWRGKDWNNWELVE